MRGWNLYLFVTLGISGCGDGEPRLAQPASPPAAGAFEELPRVRPLDPPAIDGALALSPSASGPDVVATWIEPASGAAHRVRFAVLRGATGTWSSPSTVIESAEVLPSSVDFPVPVRTADGAYLATLLIRGRAEHASHVQLAASSDGLSWRVVGLVHDDASDTEHGHASLFVEREGVRIVWLDGRAGLEGGPMALRTASIGRDGAIGASSVLDPRVCDCCQTTGAAAASGSIVAYRDRSDSEVRDIATVRAAGERAAGERAAGEAWTVPSTVHADRWTIRGCPVNGPQLAADASHVALAWYTEGGGAPHVRVALSSDAGASFGDPIEIDPARPLGRLDIEWASDGTALVVWLGQGGERDEVAVRARRISRDGRLGAPIEIARTGASRPTGVPRLAVLGEQMLVTWTEAGPPRRVRAALFAPHELPAPTEVPGAPPTPSAPGAPLLVSAAPAAPPTPSEPGAPVPSERGALPMPSERGALARGAPLPPASFEDLRGQGVALDSFRGRPIVVSFFAAWCAPCREELPLLSQLARANADRLHVIGVSIDESSLDAIARFAREHDLPYTILHDRDGAAARYFGVPPIPATFVFDARGTLVYRRGGGGEELLRELSEAVASALRGDDRGREHGHGHEHDPQEQ